MRRQELFLNVLKDLRSKIKSNDPYQLIKSSELIRTLLFDSSGPLVHKLNREHKLKIEFKYNDAKDTLDGYKKAGIPIPTTFMIADGFFPGTAIAKSKTVTEKLDNFLKALLIYHGGREYSVKDILNHAVNFLGGTHHDDPKKEKELVLTQLNNELLIGGHSSIVLPLKAIGLVVLDALAELESKVRDA
jgi:hypothetical protein